MAASAVLTVSFWQSDMDRYIKLTIFITEEAYQKLLDAQCREGIRKSHLINDLIIDCLGDEDE